MWTTLGALVLIGGLIWLAIRYAKADVEGDMKNAAALALADEEKERRDLSEKQHREASEKRVEEFNAKAAAVTDAAGAAELLKEAARRTTR
jgi:predicted lipid-binding transport protein (Tim44 family)